MSIGGTNGWSEETERRGTAALDLRDFGSRSVSSLLRMAGPLVVSRAGLALMGLVSAVLVAHAGAGEFARVALAEGTFGRLVDICVTFMASGLVLFARLRRTSDRPERVGLWLRMVISGLILGLVAALASLLAEPVLRLFGEPAALAAGTASVIRVLGPAIPAALVAMASALLLEGVGEAATVARWILGANLVNAVVGALLVHGVAGIPPLGAVGTAIASDTVRVLLCVGLTWHVLAREGRNVWSIGTIDSERRRNHLRLGFSASGTAGGMHMMGLMLTLMAGWLGALPLAIYSSMWILNLPGTLVALGLGDAISLRFAGNPNAATRNRLLLHDLGVLALCVLPISLALGFGASLVAGIYTSDAVLADALSKLLPLSAIVLFLDALTLGAVGVLRALNDIRALTAIQLASMLVAPPAAAVLAFAQTPFGRLGLTGLIAAVVATSALRTLAILARLAWHLKPQRPAFLISDQPIEGHIPCP